MNNNLPFALPLRGTDASPLVDFILLAEFDIDKGSTVRHCYPSETGIIDSTYTKDYFANNMLPEGVHNRLNDWTYIILNRTSPQLDDVTWSRPISHHHHESTAASARRSDEVHNNSDGKYMLFGINLVQTMYDASVRRGAIVKAMTIFSRYHTVDVFRSPLLFALDTYFSNPYVEILATLFDSLNTIDMSSMPMPNIITQNLMTRGVPTTTPTMNRQSNEYKPSAWNVDLEVNYYGNKLSITFPIYRSPDEIDATNLSLLIKLFGKDGSMKIYNHILTGQRVLFVGYNHSAYEVCQMVISAIAMVSPPVLNIIRRTFPYANLTDLSFLKVPGYISGVTNPLFQDRFEWWDLLCIIDVPNGTGTVHTSEEKRNESLHKGSRAIKKDEATHEVLDARFISRVLSGALDQQGEDWVKQEFREYTLSILAQAADLRNLRNSAKLVDKCRRMFDLNAQRVDAVRKSQLCSLNLATPSPFVTQSQLQLSSMTPVKGSIENIDRMIAQSSKGQESVEYIPEAEVSSAHIDTEENTSETADESAVETSEESRVVEEEGERERDDSKHVIALSHLRRLQCECDLSSVYEVGAIYTDLDDYLASEASIQAMLISMPESNGGPYLIALGLLHQNPSVKFRSYSILKRMQEFRSTRQAFESLNGFFLRAYSRHTKKFEDGALERESLLYEQKQSALRSQKNAMRDKPFRDRTGVKPLTLPSDRNSFI